MGTETDTSIIGGANDGAAGDKGKDGAGAGAGGAAGEANLTVEQKTAADKTAADTKAAEAAKNAELDIKLPEGFKADPAALTDFKKLAKEVGLDSEKASKVFGLYAKAESARAQAQETALDQQEKTWVEEVKADKEMGGANLKATQVAINKALVRFDPKGEFKQLLTNAGLGSHPTAVRLLRAVGLAGAEDHVGSGAGGADSVPTREQELRERFPNSYDAMNGKSA